MAHPQHAPTHPEVTHYPQLQQQRREQEQEFAQDFGQRFPAFLARSQRMHVPDMMAGIIPTRAEVDEDGQPRYPQAEEGPVSPAPRQPNPTSKSRRQKSRNSTPTTTTVNTDAIQTLLSARPALIPPPRPIASSSTPATAGPTSSRNASIATARERAFEQFIAMHLRREKERKRKADYRARKRQEAVDAQGDANGEEENEESATGDTVEQGMQDVEEGPNFPESGTSSSQHMYQQQPSHQHQQYQQHQHQQHQQHQVIDPQLVGQQSEGAYSGRASSAPGGMGSGKVQVRVGDRMVAIELEHVERIIREQQAQQQAQAQHTATSSSNPLVFASSQHGPSTDNHSHSGHVEPRQIHDPNASGTTAGGTADDDGITLEALMASASRHVPWPNSMHHSGDLTGDTMMDLEGDHSQREHEHDLSSMSLNTDNGLVAHPSSYASLSSLSSMIGHTSGQTPLMEGMTSSASRNVSPVGVAASGMNAGTTALAVPKQVRQLTNWYQPILWTLIDETAEKFGFANAATIARHLKQTVSPRLFSRLGERQVRKWINTEKTGWKSTVLEKVTRQEVLAHVQAGLITVPSGSGPVNVSDSSMNAFGERASKGAAGQESIHDTLVMSQDHALRRGQEEEVKRKRRKIGDGSNQSQVLEDMRAR